MSWMSSDGVVLARDDQQVLGQRELPLAEEGVGDGQDLLRPAHRGVGHVPFAGDGQEQGVDTGGIDGVDRVDARDHAGDDRAGQLVDQGAEGRVLLRRAADRGEWPDGIARDGRRARRAAPENRA